jgi:TP901-1 family phage major tail protein
MGKVKGTDVYLKVNTGTEVSPVWTKVGGQKDATFDRGSGTIDVTDKDSQGWEENLPGNRNWSISFESFVIEDDAGFLEIEDAFDNQTQKQYQIITPGHLYQGKATVEALSMAGPNADAGAFSFTLKGTGELEKDPS